jgi:DNA polymerase III subunit epsilon
MREIIFDLEATGLYISRGHRVVEVTALEMVDGKLTGKQFSAIVNPGRHIPEETVRIHGITDEIAAKKPPFAAIAQDLRAFIGNDPIVITCRVKRMGYMLDQAFLDMEMKKAGLQPFKTEQWLNVRPWSQAMFGNDNATLNKVAGHYNIDIKGRGAHTGHSAANDAQLLAAVYPLLKADYARFQQSRAKKPAAPKPRTP